MLKAVKIAIIDSGVAGEKSDQNLKQYAVSNGNVQMENPIDYYGHGSSMVSIINNNVNNNCEIISLRVVQGENGKIDRPIILDDICTAIEFAIKEKVNVINISIGVLQNSGNAIKRIEDICSEAISRDILIVTSANTNNEIVYPWACKNVIKVMMGKLNNNTIDISKDSYGNNVIVVNRKYVKGRRSAIKGGFISGNSAATALISSYLSNCYQYEKTVEKVWDMFVKKYVSQMPEQFVFDDLFESIEIVKKKCELISRDLSYIKNACVVPFSKEMISLLRFEKNVSFDIRQVIDPLLKGNNGKDPFEVIGVRKSNVKISDRIDLKDKKIDTLIIGYTDEIRKLDSYFELNNLLNIALENNINVFSLEEIDYEIKEKFTRKGLVANNTGIIDREKLINIRECIPHRVAINKPILGVFGTSSKQGKFTLQLKIHNMLKIHKLNSVLLGTEHQSELLGAVMSFPFGYSAEKSIKINLEDQIDFLQRTLVYIENTMACDIILTGGQSRLIPYNIQKESLIHNMAFLEGIKPDMAVLVINPLVDNEEYVIDTIRCLESVFKCQVLAIAFSDKTPLIVNGRYLIKKLDMFEKEEIKNNLENKYGKKSGCIMDDDFINEIVKLIIEYCD